ncbi:T9SS type A sorting domain-containing protein [Puteibacter caeruleilacunae]|nr:T9SS type A sorting domain-containing protein [Puteibacter caeruleilacunae]
MMTKKIVLLFMVTWGVCLHGQIKGNEKSATVNNADPRYSYSLEPDLPIKDSNASVEADIATIIDRYCNKILGTSAPSASSLQSAVNKYNAYNIVITDGAITGNKVKSYNDLGFLRTFAQQLRHHPDDADTKEKANNIIWLVCDQFIEGQISLDYNGYSVRTLFRPAMTLRNLLSAEVRDMLTYVFYKHLAEFKHFWEADYSFAYQSQNNAINTDHNYNHGDALMAFCATQETPEERYRYMLGFQRWLNRFLSITSGTAEGHKPDGTGFHHWFAYDTYMCTHGTAVKELDILNETQFQVSAASYKVLRDALMAKVVYTNKDKVLALSHVGRKPHSRYATYSQNDLRTLAKVGGKILALDTPDPVLAGIYNGIWGVSSDLDYSGVTPKSDLDGFFQFNWGTSGVYRKDDWVAVMRGFSNWSVGTEILNGQNRYGRYQSYGAVEIIYPGNVKDGNGYDGNSWNWNHNPGTTSILMPWQKLLAEKERVDELQTKTFAGSLAFDNKHIGVLEKIHGASGVFGMDFQQKEGLGWKERLQPESHNSTFVFKKSVFAFDDMLVSLGSNISNDDTNHPTITTLFQRMNNTSKTVKINNSNASSSKTVSAGVNSVLSNYSTGFVIVAGDAELKYFTGTQSTPKDTQKDPLDQSTYESGSYSIAYLNHGTKPSAVAYEYITLPGATSSEVESMKSKVKNGQKPYEVIQQNEKAHIVKHEDGLCGYAVFDADASLNDASTVKTTSSSCLIMHSDALADEMRIAVTKPDLGMEWRSYTPVEAVHVRVTLKGEWSIMGESSDVSLISSSETQTVLEFTIVDAMPAEVELKNHTVVTGAAFDKLEERSIKVFPNPASLEINVASNKLVGGQWSLFNVTGMKMGNGVIDRDEFRINLNAFRSGVYILKLDHQDLEKAILERVVVNK